MRGISLYIPLAPSSDQNLNGGFKFRSEQKIQFYTNVTICNLLTINLVMDAPNNHATSELPQILDTSISPGKIRIHLPPKKASSAAAQCLMFPLRGMRTRPMHTTTV